MELETYFEFINDKAIRIAGTRVGIETVLSDYHEGASPEEIALHYPTLTLEQVHASITYYLANREMIRSYMNRLTERWQEAWQEQQNRPSKFVQKLRNRLEKERSIRSTEREQTTKKVGL